MCGAQNRESRSSAKVGWGDLPALLRLTNAQRIPVSGARSRTTRVRSTRLPSSRVVRSYNATRKHERTNNTASLQQGLATKESAAVSRCELPRPRAVATSLAALLVSSHCPNPPEYRVGHSEPSRGSNERRRGRIGCACLARLRSGECQPLSCQHSTFSRRAMQQAQHLFARDMSATNPIDAVRQRDGLDRCCVRHSHRDRHARRAPMRVLNANAKTGLHVATAVANQAAHPHQQVAHGPSRPVCRVSNVCN